MGMEGGRFEHAPELSQRRRSEDPLERGIETRNEFRIEGSLERENPSWLSEILGQDRVEKISQYPAYLESSREWVILEILQADLVEKGADMDPAKKARLHNLLGILRMAFYPNMNDWEQEFIHDLMTETTTVDFSSFSYDINSEARRDVGWIWHTFGLHVPSGRQIRALPTPFSQTIDQLSLGSKPETQ